MERIRYGMRKNNEKSKTIDFGKDLKMIDYGQVLNRIAFFTNMFVAVPLAFVNAFCWHKEWLAGCIIGWCLSSIVASFVDVRVSDHNFKCIMQDFEKIRKAVEEDGEEELQSGRGQDTSNDDKEA